MTNFDFTGMSQLNDVESFNVDALMRSFCIPPRTRWKWIKTASRDNSRTPMQWTAEPGAGFTDGKPWLGINGNHVKINYRDQQGREDSVLAYYKKMIAMRAASDTLKYGDFAPVYASSDVIAYTRTMGREQYVIILNFSGKKARADLKSSTGAAFKGEIVATNTGRETFVGGLEPWEAVVLKV
jgi:oligo-1,6-glucosidase